MFIGSKLRLFAILPVITLLQACATTNPGTAAGIYYRMPRTDALVTLTLDVEACTPRLKVESGLKIDPVAGLREGLWHVSGEELASAMKKRSLTIDVDDNGLITGVNATTADQTAAVLGSIIKIAAIAATFAQDNPESSPVIICSAATQTNLALTTALPTQINQIKAGLATSPKPEDDQKRIDALAAQLVAAKAALHVETTAKLKLETTMSGTANAKPLEFDLTPLKDVFTTGFVGTNPKQSIPGIDNSAKPGLLVKAYYVPVELKNGLNGGNTSGVETCKMTITVPATQNVKVMLDHSGSIVRGNGAEVSQLLPASQLGTDGLLCLSAGFGENRTLGLKFDKYGRTSEFSYSAESRATTVAGALAGAAPDASTFVKTLQGRKLADDKAELDRLTTEQSLAKARACQQLLDAGASSCPKE